MSGPVDAAELRARDGQARRAAQTDFERPLVLEAGAGTGKTSTLIARLLHWCLGPGWERAAARLTEDGADATPAPEAIARRTMDGVHAITFTDAAAAEMSRRAGDALADLAADRPAPPGLNLSPLGLPHESLHRRAEALLGGLDHLTIQTFHSWCRSLLAAWPLEAGIHPGFTVDADARLTEALSEEILEASLAELYGAEAIRGGAAGPAVRLLAFGVGPEELRQTLHELIQAGVPAAELADEAFTAERMRQPLSQVAAAAGELASLLAPLLELPGVTNVVGGAHELAVRVRTWATELLDRSLGAAAVEVAARAMRDDLNPARLDTLKSWAHRKYGSQWAARHLPGLEPRLSPCCGLLAMLLPGFLRLEPTRHELLRQVLARLMATVEEEKRRRGVLTFDDLLDRALALLRRQPAVAARLRKASEQLLVDEFQDTDPRQCELVRCLALEGPEDGRPGLFIVGDPKQSLYGWRQADLAAYERFVKDVLAGGGTRHTLSVNFRSVPAILDEVKRAVAPVMQQEAGLQPPFGELLPHPDRAAAVEAERDGLPPVEYWTLWEQEEDGLSPMSAERAAEREAAAVAHDLLDLHARGAPWSDAAILLRSRGRLPTVLDAMRAAGIPFLVQGERSYFQRREVVEAQALLRTIVQPRDRLALVTLLRSAWVGVPDAALLPLFAGGLDQLLARADPAAAPTGEEVERLARRVAASLPPGIPGLEALAGWEESLLHAVGAVGALRRSFAAESPDRFVAKLRRLLLVDATEAARAAGAFRCANLDRFFRELETELEEEGDVAGLLRFLHRSVEGARESPAAPPAEATDDAVRVMTIHGAKGLDFGHVYLLQAASTGRRGNDPFSARRPLEPAGRWALTLHGTDNPERLASAVEERRREGAERVRLLYVAMTRPRRRLVISGIWPANPHPLADPLAAESFRHLLAHRTDLPVDLQELFRRNQGEPAIEAGGAWWRFLLAQAEVLPPSQRPAAPWIPSDADLSRTFAEQARRREDALRRQACPLILRASDNGVTDDVEESWSGDPASASPVPGDATSAPEADVSRGLARAVGTAIHRMFEAWNPDADPDDEYRRHSDAVLRAVAPTARERASELLSAFHDGPLHERWRLLLPHLEARELPILIPWLAERQDGVPDGALVGTIDLVYRDPETDEVVLGDFKTDRVGCGGPTLAEHAERYRSQADAYRRAVARALGQDALPRFELWFLDAGEIVALPPEPADAAAKPQSL